MRQDAVGGLEIIKYSGNRDVVSTGFDLFSDTQGLLIDGTTVGNDERAQRVNLDDGPSIGSGSDYEPTSNPSSTPVASKLSSSAMILIWYLSDTAETKLRIATNNSPPTYGTAFTSVLADSFLILLVLVQQEPYQ